MNVKTIAILMPGDMGHACAQVFKKSGYRVVTDLTSRSERTLLLAKKCGIENLGSLERVILESDIILSIMPPEFSLIQAKKVSKSAQKINKQNISYVDCNAISPMTALELEKVFKKTNINFIDGGIIGHNPIKENGKTRLYISGPNVRDILQLDGKGMQIRYLDKKIGRASAIKMTYASATKGTFSLHAAVAITAYSLNITEELFKEFSESQPTILHAIERMVPKIPLDAARWKFEMDEISRTFKEQGVTSKFHEGASEIMTLANNTPIALENRENVNENRTLIEALEMYKKAQKKQ